MMGPIKYLQSSQKKRLVIHTFSCISMYALKLRFYENINHDLEFGYIYTGPGVTAVDDVFDCSPPGVISNPIKSNLSPEFLLISNLFDVEEEARASRSPLSPMSEGPGAEIDGGGQMKEGALVSYCHIRLTIIKK